MDGQKVFCQKLKHIACDLSRLYIIYIIFIVVTPFYMNYAN